MKLDDIDIKILKVLSKDGRIPNTSIAKELNVPVSTVRNRINRMQEKELVRIIGYSDPSKLGYPVTVNAFLKVESKYVESVAQKLAAMRETHAVIICAGAYDIYFRCSFKSQEEVYDFFYKSVSKLKGVTHIESHLLLKIVKRIFNMEIPEGLEI